MTAVHRFEDLVCWQLSEELKDRMIALTERERVRRDVRFCEDVRSAARSAPANIAEGFGWYDPKPNKRHVSIAKASLEETRNHILDAFKSKYIDRAERDDLLRLARRAIGATRRYLLYLKSCKSAPEATPRPRRAPGTAGTSGTGTPGARTPGTRTPGTAGTSGTRTPGTSGTPGT